MSSSEEEIFRIIRDKEKEVRDKYGDIKIKELSDQHLNELLEQYKDVVDLLTYAFENKDNWKSPRRHSWILDIKKSPTTKRPLKRK